MIDFIAIFFKESYILINLIKNITLIVLRKLNI